MHKKYVLFVCYSNNISMKYFGDIIRHIHAHAHSLRKLKRVNKKENILIRKSSYVSSMCPALI